MRNNQQRQTSAELELSSQVRTRPSEEQTGDDPTEHNSPDPSESSSKLSSPLPGSPGQIVHAQLIQPETIHQSQQTDQPPIHPSALPGLLTEIANNRFVLGCALFASLGGILFGYDVSLHHQSIYLFKSVPSSITHRVLLSSDS